MRTRIAEPCAKRWLDLSPVEGGRHCEACRRTVVDGERLTRAELDRLLETSGARVCAYLVYLPDGSLLTSDHPRSVRQAGLAAGLAAVLACAGIACSPREESSRPASAMVETKALEAPARDPVSNEMRERLGMLGYVVAEPD